jgi:hypothetical protein
MNVYTGGMCISGRKRDSNKTQDIQYIKHCNFCVVGMIPIQTLQMTKTLYARSVLQKYRPIDENQTKLKKKKTRKYLFCGLPCFKVAFRYERMSGRCAITFLSNSIWPPLWSSGQSSWIQTQMSGFDSRRYQIF